MQQYSKDGRYGLVVAIVSETAHGNTQAFSERAGIPSIVEEPAQPHRDCLDPGACLRETSRMGRREYSVDDVQ